MKLFITGTTGYIGQKLMELALSKGFTVHALVRDLSNVDLNHHKKIHYFKGDVTDYESVERSMHGCDAVLHAAGITQLWHHDRTVFYRVNVGGTRNVLEAACYHKIKKFVYTSTCGVLGPSSGQPVGEEDPRITPFENDYEISKHCAEELVKEYSRKGLFAMIVALPRVYGPGLMTQGNPISKLIGNTIRRGIAFVPDAKQIVGNYAFIDDVIEGHFLALQKGLGGEKYILGGDNHSYKEFFENIKKESPKKIRLVTLPRFLLKFSSALVYLVTLVARRHNHFTPKIVDRLYQDRAISCDKAIRQLGYQVTPLANGIQQTIQFLKAKHYV
ncbi:MAG TPA: NAD-dependent epimerase/dehydratase family protein [Flavisolibacter sp.]